MIAGFTTHSGAVTAIARLNVRRGLPGTNAPLAMKVEPGTRLDVFGVGAGQDVKGNATWFAGAGDTYFWSGGCSSFVSAASSQNVNALGAGKVNRRPDGTILPLNDTEIRKVFGTFDYKEGNGGRIIIDKGWTAANIVQLKTSILADQGYPSITVHKKAAASFDTVLKAIEQAGLASLILTCAGTFVPRHKGWDPKRGLSSHSWGVAIDLNVAWNAYGKTPAALGTQGSLRELVPYFEAEGFAWGGFFSPPYEDGMHFELARLDL